MITYYIRDGIFQSDKICPQVLLRIHFALYGLL